MKKLLAFILCFSIFFSVLAQDHEVDSLQLFMEEMEASLQYQKGDIPLENGIGILKVPDGFGYLDPKQTEFVLVDLWGNPDGTGTLGMIVPDNGGVMGEQAWAFILTYEEMGFVKDDDADDIDYNELLSVIQDEAKETNTERMRLGYEAIEIVGWAAKPYYDQTKKVLHWAKEIRFGESEETTLNYNVRILGRQGVVVLNAVASMADLPAVEENIDPVLNAFSYSDGNRYADFNPDIDEVAAWTIGGLVAGKVLAKAGILALLLKNIKLIGLGLAGLFAGIWKWYKRRTELPSVRTIGGNDKPEA